MLLYTYPAMRSPATPPGLLRMPLLGVWITVGMRVRACRRLRNTFVQHTTWNGAFRPSMSCT